MFNQNNTKNKMKKQILTKKELQLLLEVKEAQNERGHGDFYSWDVKSKSCGGIMANLIKKGMIHKVYVDWDMDRKPFNMFIFTEEAAELVGKPKGWC